MRGLKKKEMPVLRGYPIFHSYIRPHESLHDKTPAEACGTEIKGEYKWIILIKMQAKKQRLPDVVNYFLKNRALFIITYLLPLDLSIQGVS